MILAYTTNYPELEAKSIIIRTLTSGLGLRNSMNHYHYLFSNYILLPHLAMKVQVVLLGLDVLLGQDQLVDLQGGLELFEEG